MLPPEWASCQTVILKNLVQRNSPLKVGSSVEVLLLISPKPTLDKPKDSPQTCDTMNQEASELTEGQLSYTCTQHTRWGVEAWSPDLLVLTTNSQ